MKPEDQPIIQGQEYQSLPETIADLDWMEMIILDFSLFNESGGKEKLASQLKYAIHNLGCFYIINFGLSQDEINQQFSLATSIFGLPQSEKNKFIDCKSNPTLGYKPAGERTMTQGIKDAVEIYDDPKCNSFFESYLRPPPCAKQKGETGRLCKVIHEQVLHRLLVLTTIIMEIADEESLSIIHNFDAMSDSRLRYMIQHPRSEEEVNVLQQGEEGDDDIIYRHTDFGTYTLLFNQPIAALQVKSKDSTWKWVKPLPGSIIGNVGVRISPAYHSVIHSARTDG
jgi:isopenicillin N synthase-like dioxygenase